MHTRLTLVPNGQWSSVMFVRVKIASDVLEVFETFNTEDGQDCLTLY